MSATQRTRSAKTEHFYAITYTALRAQAAADIGAQTPEHVAPTQLVEHLIGRKSQLAKRTWQTYKSAVRAQLEHLMAEGGTPEAPTTLQDAQEIRFALQQLADETQTEALSKTNNTSALKAKNLATKDFQAICDHLQELIEGKTLLRGPRSNLARALLTWCKASDLTGVRPSEWASADLVELDGLLTLKVRNAKNTQGRANGEFRHLDLTKLTPGEMAIVEQQLELIDGHRDAESFAALQLNMRLFFHRVARRVLGKRDRYPSLYTFRHQFSADAKSGNGRREVAAMMGHASDATAGRSYAKAKHGRGGVRVAPIAAEVQTVRLKAKPRPLRNPR